MGTLTLSDFLDEVKGHLGNRTDLSDTQLTRALNLCQTRMCRLHDFRELQTVFAGQSIAYTGVPSTDRFLSYSTLSPTQRIDDVISFVLYQEGTTNSRKLDQYTARQLDALVPAAELFTTNMPSIYVRWKERFELFPVPDQEYLADIRAILKPTALSASGDTSDLEDKDDLIVFLTTSYLFGRLGEYDRANQFFAIYRDEFNNAMDDDQDNADLDIKPRHIGKAIGTVDYWKDPFIRKV